MMETVKILEKELKINTLSLSELNSVYEIVVNYMFTTKGEVRETLEKLVEKIEKRISKLYYESLVEYNKEFKTNNDIKKRIAELVKHEEAYRLQVQIFTSCDLNRIMTDLEITIFDEDDNDKECLWVCGIEGEDFDGLMEKHEKILEKEQTKLVKYLGKYFDNVTILKADCQ